MKRRPRCHSSSFETSTWVCLDGLGGRDLYYMGLDGLVAWRGSVDNW